MTTFAARLGCLWGSLVALGLLGCNGPLIEPFQPERKPARTLAPTTANDGQPGDGQARPGAEVVLLDFTATWCGPCKTMEPTIHGLQQAGYAVRQVDIDREPALATQYNIRAVPTFVLVVNGQEAARLRGVVSYTQLERLFQQYQTQPQ